MLWDKVAAACAPPVLIDRNGVRRTKHPGGQSGENPAAGCPYNMRLYCYYGGLLYKSKALCYIKIKGRGVSFSKF